MKKFIFSLLTMVLLTASFGIVSAQTYVYLRSNGGEPWGQPTNDVAMDAVFGAGNWTTNYFETVNATSMFNTASVIFIDGSQAYTAQMNTFLSNNQTALENWVSGGGRLFLNAAPNYVAGTYPLGFGGVTLNYCSCNNTFCPSATATLPSDPIFQGPYLPVGTSWSGNYFAHATLINGPGGLIQLITGNTQAGGTGVVCEKLFFGNGVVIFGTMTTTNFHQPQPQATNLRENILSYLKTVTLVVVPNTELALQPKVLNFGLVSTGQTVQRFFTIFNAGTGGTLTVSQMQLSGDIGDFAIISPPPPPLTPGQSSTILVSFSPTRSGPRSATIKITSNGRDSGTQTVSLVGLGAAPHVEIDTTKILFNTSKVKLGDSVTQYVKVISDGQGPVTFTSIIIAPGSDQDQYFVSYFPQNPLPSGQTDSIGVTFSPTREGRHIGTLVINTNAPNLPIANVSLGGYGIIPKIVVTPPQILFDSTAEGDTVCKQVSIQNVGSDTLKIFQNFLSSNDGDFILTGLSGKDTLIAPDQTKILTVCFHPLQQGTRQARLTIRTNIPLTFETPRRDTGSTYVVEIRGNGLPLGVLSNKIVGPLILDSIPVGQSVCRTDSLCNTGDADVTVTSATFSDPEFAEGTRKLPAVPFVIKARQCIVFDLCGTPTQQGLRTGALTISGTSNSRTRTTGAIQLAVYGLNLCASPLPTALFLGTKVPKDSTATQCDTITNCGEVAAIYTASLSGADKADYTITSPNPSPSIPPGGTYLFCVNFKVSTETTTTASLDVATPDVTTLHIPLTAAGVCATLTHDAPSIPPTAASASNTFTFTITNGGTGDWTPGTPVIAGANAADYTLVSITPDPIPAGKTGTVTMKFSPPLGSAGTSQIANISWPNGGPCQNATVSVDLASPTVASVTTDMEADGFNLDQSHPNPTQGKATFTYTTPRECEVKISLVDMTGKVLETLVNGNVSPGEYTVSFDASKYPSGTYIYMLESGSVKLVRQLILTK